MKYLAILVGVMFGLLGNLHAQTVTIDDVNPENLEIKAFNLSKSATVKISGSGGVFRDDYRLLLYYGWILDADTREVVWHLFDEMKDDEFRKSDGVYDFSVELPLKQGNYELYFTGAYDTRGWGNNFTMSDWTIDSFDALVDEIFDSRDKEKFRRSLQDDLMISVSGTGVSSVSVDALFDAKVKKAPVYFLKAENKERFEQGFTLTASTDIRIYALGEGRKDEIFDYVWIYNAASRERVFEMNYKNTDFAGGADKNLRVDEQITLPAGSYIVSYRTDDSHSFEKWNALPPDDPQFWGVALFPATEADRKNFATFKAPKSMQPVAELVKVRNHALVSKGFSLNKEMDVRVLCLGESSSYDDMADYGWIVDANTRKTVWKMRGYKTEHAGGASKNRRFEDVLTLDKGDYIAYYTTDGSHAYNSWNAASPHEEDRWGMTLWATNDNEVGLVTTFEVEDFVTKNLIAELLMPSDNAYLKKIFVLDKDTKVTIMAIGEGSDNRMYDYGWIKNMNTGEVVWEMDYYDTDHAGGARKNRMVVENLRLPKGEYRLNYETDGSHSFNDWNADPPNDPQSYGIRVLIAE
ncbi:hypothetical protein [Marinoscillum luteum]|uniref:Uncharacterized protein n=1 Tax=Marinoscillum luteum TaxID=861051 RepID=A0ABW7N9B7_9BACT